MLYIHITSLAALPSPCGVFANLLYFDGSSASVACAYYLDRLFLFGQNSIGGFIMDASALSVAFNTTIDV